MQYINEVISTRRMRKFKSHTPQNIIDQKEILERIQATGVRMDYVDAYIERQLNCYITFKTMLCFCRRIARELGLKVDRLAKRNRNALLCWMAENWELIEPRIGDILLLIDKNNDEYSTYNQDDEIEYDSSPEIKDEEPSPIESKKVTIPCIDEFIYTVGPTAGFILADLLNPDPSDILQLLNFH